MSASEHDLIPRAFAAYFRSVSYPEIYQQPSNTSGIVEHDGKEYVVLHNTNGILAVYRVIYRITNPRTTYDPAQKAFVTDGRFGPVLKRMKRWPKAIEEDFA